MAGCIHVQEGQTCPFEAEHREYDQRMTRFHAEQGIALYALNNERETLRIEERYGLYCSICLHGNGCAHGVPKGRATA